MSQLDTEVLWGYIQDHIQYRWDISSLPLIEDGISAALIKVVQRKICRQIGWSNKIGTTASRHGVQITLSSPETLDKLYAQALEACNKGPVPCDVLRLILASLSMHPCQLINCNNALNTKAFLESEKVPISDFYPQRLIDTHSLQLVDLKESTTAPRYAILSHRWIKGEEVAFGEFLKLGEGTKSKSGYYKIRAACQQAKKDGFSYIWIDTCCIDNESNDDVARNIRSMYAYYRNASVCYAYLADVHSWRLELFENSEWFNRGWTLQELVAPHVVKFFDRDWNYIGSKVVFKDVLGDLTGIPSKVLSGEQDVQDVGILERMSWALGRTTTKLQDRAYCLQGLLGVSIDPDYNEDISSAFNRLRVALEAHPEYKILSSDMYFCREIIHTYLSVSAERGVQQLRKSWIRAQEIHDGLDFLRYVIQTEVEDFWASHPEGGDLPEKEASFNQDHAQKFLCISTNQDYKAIFDTVHSGTSLSLDKDRKPIGSTKREPKIVDAKSKKAKKKKSTRECILIRLHYLEQKIESLLSILAFMQMCSRTGSPLLLTSRDMLETGVTSDQNRRNSHTVCCCLYERTETLSFPSFLFGRTDEREFPSRNHKDDTRKVRKIYQCSREKRRQIKWMKWKRRKNKNIEKSSSGRSDHKAGRGVRALY